MAKELDKKELEELCERIGPVGVSLLCWLVENSEAIDKTLSVKRNSKKGDEGVKDST